MKGAEIGRRQIGGLKQRDWGGDKSADVSSGTAGGDNAADVSSGTAGGDKSADVSGGTAGTGACLGRLAARDLGLYPCPAAVEST